MSFRKLHLRFKETDIYLLLEYANLRHQEQLSVSIRQNWSNSLDSS